MKRRGVILIKQAASAFYKAPKYWQYYLLGLLLILLSFIIPSSLSWFIFVLGILISGAGFYVYFLDLNLRKATKDHLPTSNSGGGNNINTNGGNYNEFINGDYLQGNHIQGNYIKGDYINIQGSHINIDQDLSQFNSQIQEILSYLKNQSSSKEEAENQIIQELNNQASKNSKFRKKLFEWKRSLNILTDDTELIAEYIVRHTLESSTNTPDDFIFSIERKYQVLDNLLKAGKWQEADEETARLINSLMPDHYWSSLKAEEIPPGDLKKINHLWLKYSKKHFGFSVQQDIWRDIFKAYPYQNEGRCVCWKREDAYKYFISKVGWSFEDNRLYYNDLKYSLTAPSGHLPAKIMFKVPKIDYYSNYSNYCDLNQKVFDGLMKRQYKDYAFIPQWLRQWLSMD